MDAEAVILTVRDYGRGIPHEIVRQFREHGSGVGVGLSGMRERMNELGGSLEIVSDHGETTVSAKLAWDDDTHHHLSDASLHAVIASPAREAEVRKLVDDAGRHCPVCQAISGSVALHVTADVIPV